MKKLMTFLFGAALIIVWAGSAGAASYKFSDMIDKWDMGGFQFDAAYIDQGRPLSYKHDLNQEVDFGRGDMVTEAYLELDFTNDRWPFGRLPHLREAGPDSYGSINLWNHRIEWDFREFATYAIGESGTSYDIGEVDNQSYSGLFLNVDWLNDDGELDVTVSVHNPLGSASPWNPLGRANAWLDHSRLYGTAEMGGQAAPVPEPSTIMLMGVGLLGLVGYSRKRLAKKEDR
jgi:hypothetical protein